jgi:2-oxoglutarate dehydrogenase E2 component (dihydrolipoamide succinyltransferase)
MAVEIKVPSVGESITEGTLSRWLKQDGDTVRTDEPVFELETDKATGDIPAPATGVLHILVPAGQTIAIGTVVGRIEEKAAAEGAKPDKKAGPPPREAKADNAPKPSAKAPAEKEVLLSPAARRVAEEEGVDINALTGSGRGGRITKEDVLAQLESRRTKPEAPPPEKTAREGDKEARRPGDKEPEKPPEKRAAEGTAPPAVVPGPPPPTPTARETRQRMSSIRQRIAERLVTSQQATATLTTFNEADLSAVNALRGRYKDRFRDKHGVGLGFMSFFVKACVEALRAFPIVNARVDGPDIVYQHFYDIGVAVSTERGLMVPVLRDGDRLSFAQIEKQLAALAQKAREGKITVDDLQGGTFTITNGGVFGSLVSTPILNPPQSAILGMHAIHKRPVAVDDQVVIRPMMYLALSYDHRLIDGRDAVQFLVRVKECVEDPERLLLEI